MRDDDLGTVVRHLLMYVAAQAPPLQFRLFIHSGFTGDHTVKIPDR